MPEQLEVFLDANVLFSASYKEDHKFLEFWNTRYLVPMTSSYAVQEARRNCWNEDHFQRLELLVEKTVIVSDASQNPLPPGITLPPKDRPILTAAINAGADFLITGDKDHFARLMNQPIRTRHGVLTVMRPRPFLDWLKAGR